MATAPEVLAIERLHQAAQARLGIAAAYLALAQWESVNALDSVATSATWVAASVRIITAVRKMSRQLAISYYQLVRAVETGSTLGEPPGSTGNVELRQLRKKFRDTALDIAALPTSLSPSDDPDIRWFEEELRRRDMPEARTPGRLIRLEDAEVEPLVQDLLDVEGSDNPPITVDEYKWEQELSHDDVAELFEELLRKRIVEQADLVRNLRSNDDLTPNQAMKQIEKTHASAGSLGSGSVDAFGLEGGRQAIDEAITVDRRIKLVARGTGPDPCAFCSMLASRGFVFTGSTSGVGDSDDGTVGDEIKKYHVNCHCYPIVRFINTSDTLPPLNAYFQEKWPEVTAGYSGVNALNAWRRWIYAQRKANPNAPHAGALT